MEHRSPLPSDAGRWVHPGLPINSWQPLLFPLTRHFPPGTVLGRGSRGPAPLQERIAQPARAWHRRLAPHNGTIHLPVLPLPTPPSPHRLAGAAHPEPGSEVQPLTEVRGSHLTGSGCRSQPPSAQRFQRPSAQRPPPRGGAVRHGPTRRPAPSCSCRRRQPLGRRSGTCAPRAGVLPSPPGPAPPHPKLPGGGCVRRQDGEAGQPVHGRACNPASPARDQPPRQPGGAPGPRPAAVNPDLLRLSHENNY